MASTQSTPFSSRAIDILWPLHAGRCAEPVVAEDMYGDRRCARCGGCRAASAICTPATLARDETGHSLPGLSVIEQAQVPDAGRGARSAPRDRRCGACLHHRAGISSRFTSALSCAELAHVAAPASTASCAPAAEPRLPREGRPARAGSRCSSSGKGGLRRSGRSPALPASSRRSNSHGSGVDRASTRSLGRGFARHSAWHFLEFPRDAREVPRDPGHSVLRRLWAEA